MPPKPPACNCFAVPWISVWIMPLPTNPSPKTHIWVPLVHFWISKAFPGLKRSGLDWSADRRWQQCQGAMSWTLTHFQCFLYISRGSPAQERNPAGPRRGYNSPQDSPLSAVIWNFFFNHKLIISLIIADTFSTNRNSNPSRIVRCKMFAQTARYMGRGVYP